MSPGLKNAHSKEAEAAELLGGGNNPAPDGIGEAWLGWGRGPGEGDRTNRTECFPFFDPHSQYCSLGQVRSIKPYSLLVEGKTGSKHHYHQKINSYCEALTKCQAQALSTQSHDESLA